MSIRLRLTLLFSVILALTIAAFSAILYINVSRSTENFVKDDLIDEGHRLVDARQINRDSIELDARFAAPETYVQTLDAGGQIADRTPNLGDIVLPLSSEGLTAVQSGQSWTETAKIEDAHVLIFSTPIYAGDTFVGIAQVARTLTEQDRSLATLRTILIVAGSIAVGLAVLGGWILAGATLRPIKKLTESAAAIGAERNFSKRVAYKGPKDELGALSTTINGMLQELEESYQQVQQSLLAQRRFVADASHELRTPLTTIRGNLGLLGREPSITQEDREEVLRDVISECERLMRLVNQLLALARADAGQPLRHEPVYLEPLVEDVCRQARLLSADKSIETAGEATTALGDPDAIKQVLLILVDNALKYTPASGRIAVKYGSENGHVKIAVSDNGPGIEPAILAHLFDRFYRADNARAGDGTGLGLAIAKALVEAQHGTISAVSERGKGATFTLELQRAPTARPRAPAGQLSRA